MFDNDKILELKDEDFEKANGGFQYQITGVNAGDVFINNSHLDQGIVIVETKSIDSKLTSIGYKSIQLISGQWQTSNNVGTIRSGNIESNYMFSSTLTGTISY